MTAPNGPILFNSSTGSDSTSSGLGPSSAVIGSSAELDGTSTVDVSYDGMDLSSISAGDLLYCSTSSGRQFSVIASVDAMSETITTDDAWPSESGVSWAVGGKRATLDDAGSRLIVTTDNPTGEWTVELENTGSDYSITSSLPLRSVTIKGDDENNPTGVTFNQNSNLFNASTGSSTVKNLSLKCTASSKTLATAFNKAASNAGFRVHNVTFDSSDNWNKAFGRTAIANGDLRVIECKINNTITNISDWDTVQEFYNCTFSNCSGNGIASRSNTCIVKNCVFDGCSGNLIYQSKNPSNVWVIQGNVFNGGSQALRLYTYTWMSARAGAFENIFIGFTSQAIYNNPTDTSFQISRNAFYNNTAEYSGTHDDNITLTADPFTDAASGDFSLNSDAGGGAVLRAATMVMGSTTAYPFNWLTNLTPECSSPFHPLGS